MWCPAADSVLKLPDIVVRSAILPADGVLECKPLPSIICSSVMPATQDQEELNVSSERCIAIALCAGACNS